MYNIENTYLELMNNVLVKDVRKSNRTGVDTLSVHGAMLRHNTDCGFPLFTTKYLNFNSIKAELLWFLSGSSDVKDLQDLGCNIWTANAKAWGESWCPPEPDNTKIGRMYGAQWRHWRMTDTDHYKYDGFDQIQFAIHQIKNCPQARDIMVTAYEPGVSWSGQAPISPCHVCHRYSVTGDRLDLTLYQRSCDLFLGVPFNIASYALLLAMMAQVTGYKTGEIVYFLDDVHVYVNHIEQCKTQLSRLNDKCDFPRLVMEESIDDIDKFTMDDLFVVNYFHEPAIKAKMAV